MNSWLSAAAPQQPGAQMRDQIREQVQRDVERALREVQQAQGDAGGLQAEQAARAAERAGRAAERAGEAAARAAARGAFVVPAPPVPPVPPFITTTGQPPAFPHEIPGQIVDITMAFFLTVATIFIGTPLARAFARRMDRRSVAPPAAGPDVVSRLDRIEQAVDAIALEVERISEGQRYVTKVLADARALPSPNEAAAQDIRMVERAAAERAGNVRVP